MSKSALVKSRLIAFNLQHARCIYCEQPIWLKNPQTFAHQYNITLKQAQLFQCTAEHLLARRDGGKDDPTNIVAACHFCNQKRHHSKSAKDPIPYKLYVAKRVIKRKWHTSFMSKLYVSPQTYI
jgi:hypothetical protein